MGSDFFRIFAPQKNNRRLNIMSKIENLIDYNVFQYEMNRLSKITYKGYNKTLKEVGVSYLGQVNHSTKLSHNGELNIFKRKWCKCVS